MDQGLQRIISVSCGQLEKMLITLELHTFSFKHGRDTGIGSRVRSPSPPVCQMRLSHGPVLHDVLIQKHCRLSLLVLPFIKPHSNKHNWPSTGYYHGIATKWFFVLMKGHFGLLVGGWNYHFRHKLQDPQSVSLSVCQLPVSKNANNSWTTWHI